MNAVQMSASAYGSIKESGGCDTISGGSASNNSDIGETASSQVIIVMLVTIDCLLIVVELLAERRVLEVVGGHPQERYYNHYVHVLHHLSIAILSIFVVEIIAKVYAFSVIGFLNHKLEVVLFAFYSKQVSQVFDAFIVIISLILDIGFYNPDSVVSVGSSLVIVVRLWRVVRILNGIVLTVKVQTEDKLETEIRRRKSILQELLTQRDYRHVLEENNRYLRKLLQENGVEVSPPVESITRKK
ncbi:voltage-gated hydrogen channel 1-like [Varroa jacobsoni]|uniref:voltage-gated hydrogen channel 1-like n=1 Tax=Varroa jacobsoni TaxID=62625 RepID=UPI000BF3496A|nr:voltage-gated hydrogen channel 1-like [Varroa jacobsoni]